MKINPKTIRIELLQTATNFALEKGVDRKYIYILLEKDIVDYVEINGVKFVYQNDKSKHYKKTNFTKG